MNDAQNIRKYLNLVESKTVVESYTAGEDLSDDISNSFDTKLESHIKSLVSTTTYIGDTIKRSIYNNKYKNEAREKMNVPQTEEVIPGDIKSIVSTISSNKIAHPNTVTMRVEYYTTKYPAKSTTITIKTPLKGL